MALDTVKAGHGVLRYRLEVEGWPEMWVTDPSITAGSIADGRTVLTGLSFRGLSIGDRVHMRDAKVEADAITFRIVPPGGSYVQATDPLLASLSRYPQPVAELLADVDEALGIVTTVESGDLDDNTVYHMGTEAFRTTTAPACTRHVWGTQPQRHNITQGDRATAVYIYDHPPTMEGRRATLWAYDGHDDSTGAGTCVWRGQVARQPRLDSRDGVTWEIPTLPITHVLRQAVAASPDEASLIGYYHHRHAAAALYIDWEGSTYQAYYTGFDPNGTALLASLNAFLASTLAAIGITEITELRLEPWSDAIRLYVTFGEVATPSYFRVAFSSTLIGLADSEEEYLRLSTTGQEVDDAFPSFAAEEYYVMGLVPDDPSFGARWTSAPSYSLGTFTAVFPADPLSHLNNAPNSQLNEWRIYVDRSFEGVDAVVLRGLPDVEIGGGFATVVGGDLTFDVVDAGSEVISAVSYHYVDLEPDPSTPWRGRIQPQTGVTVHPAPSYGGASATLGTFVQALKDKSIHANDGITPWITDEDLSDWTAPSNTVGPRRYRFATEISVEKVLSQELLMAGYIPRIEADGRIGIVRLPQPTAGTPVAATHRIETSSVASGRAIMPSIETARDGVLTSMTFQGGYDPVADEWTLPPQPFDQPDVIATHKRRGQVQLEIKPYSTPADGVEANAHAIASRLLPYFSRDYVIVTVRVPFRHFDVLCGDVVLLTHSLLPNGTGARGMVARRAVCIRRRWELDPAAPGDQVAGELDLWLTADPIYGYAPSAHVTDQTDLGSNLWELELSRADALNLRWAGTLDGNVAQHFAVGDQVRIFERDTTISNSDSGTVTVVDDSSDLVRVQFDGTWTPGTDDWVLTFDLDDGSATEHQRGYVYMADSSNALADGTRARRIA